MNMRFHAIISLFFLIFVQSTFSEMLSVLPTRVHLSSQVPIQVIRLTNNDPYAHTVQASIRQWSQKNNKDIYNKTDKILVTPIIFTIPPGKTQILRVAALAKPPLKNEGTYRLFLHEILPLKLNPYEHKDRLKIALEMILPVFVKPTDKKQSQWHWSLHRIKKNKYRLILTDDGMNTIFINRWKIKTDKKEFAPQKTFTYILPAQSHYWKIKLKNLPKVAYVSAIIDNKKTKSKAVVAP